MSLIRRAGLLLGPFALLVCGCVSLPRDHAIPAPAAPAAVSNTVRCNCVINERRADKQCADSVLCPGPSCQCPGMDFDLCLPPDLNLDTATDPAIRARLLDPKFDFNAAVLAFCRDRGQEIMTDIGSVSQYSIICNGKENDYFNIDVPALLNCQPVARDNSPSFASTWHTATCAKPCGTTLCINGPRDERPNANCDGDDVFTRTALRPEACKCNQVPADTACNGKPSEVFCAPSPGEAIQ